LKTHPWVTQDLSSTMPWPHPAPLGRPVTVTAEEVSQAVRPAAVFARLRDGFKRMVSSGMASLGGRSKSLSSVWGGGGGGGNSRKSVGGEGGASPAANHTGTSPSPRAFSPSFERETPPRASPGTAPTPAPPPVMERMSTSRYAMLNPLKSLNMNMTRFGGGGSGAGTPTPASAPVVGSPHGKPLPLRSDSSGSLISSASSTAKGKLRDPESCEALSMKGVLRVLSMDEGSSPVLSRVDVLTGEEAEKERQRRWRDRVLQQHREKVGSSGVAPRASFSLVSDEEDGDGGVDEFVVKERRVMSEWANRG
ncbi:hypothetical protein HDU98_008960, partial [Podochytrium sp. JEL0797]